MDFAENESVKEAITRAYECCDIDEDGLISLEDLKISGGLETDQEAQVLFETLKAGSSGPYVTFEEFKSGIIDCPNLLEQIKEQPKVPRLQLQIEEIEEEYIPSTSRNWCPDLEKLIQDIKQVTGTNEVNIFSPTSRNNTHPAEKLKYWVNYALKKTQYTPVHYSVTKTAAALCDYIMSKDSEHQLETQNLQQTLKDKQEHTLQLQDSLCKLKAQNQELFEALNKIEQETTQTNNELHSQLQKTKANEAKAKNQVLDVQEEIHKKETQINLLQTELRRLSSLKALEHIRGSEISPQAFHKQRLFHQTKSCFTSPVPSPKTTIKKRLFQEDKDLLQENQQLRKENQRLIASKEHDFQLFLEKEDSYRQKIEQLKAKIKDLKLEQFEIKPSEELSVSRSLFEDVHMLEEATSTHLLFANELPKPSRNRCCGLFK